MFLRSLYLHHFRNYDEAYFEFNPHFNLICGPNAQGKTNILEALHYLMVGRSFRTHQSTELIQHGAQAFYLEAKFSKHGIEQSIKITCDGKERKIFYNYTMLSSAASLLGIIPGVVITPNDVYLVKGSPLLRRQFLDLQISQTDPLYVHHLTRYTRAMRQRNQLLRAKQLITIDSWEHEMSHSAAYLILQRYRTIQDIKVHCKQIYEELTDESEQLEVTYKSHLPQQMTLNAIRNHLLESFHKHRSREMMLGHTITGPHKDDLHFMIDKNEVRHFASEGQQRSYVTAVRLAEWQQLNHTGNESPVMMVDDLGLSLDKTRCQKLLHRLTSMGQVFLTTTNEHLLNGLTVSQKTFSIRKGQVVSEV